MEARLNKWYTYLESDSSGKPLQDKTSKKASKSPNEKASKKSPVKTTDDTGNKLQEEKSTTLPLASEVSNETDEQMQTNISTENACADPVEPSQMETTPT